MIEARFRFKVRTTPGNSSIDDTTNPSVTAGLISQPGTGAWTDEVTITLDGMPGSRDIGVLFKSNSENRDHIIEVTAEVTMEDEDANGNIIQFDEASTILVRAAIFAPRLYFSRLDGPDFVPVAHEAIRPVSLMDRSGTQAPPSVDETFYVELRCHDVGPSIDCYVRTPGRRTISLHQVSSSPGFALYRSNPCYVYSDDSGDGSAGVTQIPDTEMFAVRPGAEIEARIRTAMPGNTDDITYRTGRRPISSFHLVETGDSARQDRAVPPVLHIDTRDDGTWVAAVDATGLHLQVGGWVRDAVSEISGVPPTEVTINGQPVGFSAGSDVATFGRPNGWIGNFSAHVDAFPGLQTVTLRVENALGVASEARFAVEVLEASNDFVTPTALEARVRPVGAAQPYPAPFLTYLYASGTAPEQGAPIPPQFDASLAVLDPFPSTQQVAGGNVTMQHLTTAANGYVSQAHMVVRTDQVPSGPNPLPNILAMPLGGRLEWRTAQMPNALGPLIQEIRREHSHFDVELVKQTSPTTWDTAHEIVNGDVITAHVQVYPDSSGPPNLYLRFVGTDSIRVEGDDREVNLQFAPAGSGTFALQGYLDGAFNFHQASEIAVAEATAPAATPPPLRIFGAGRMLVVEDVDPLIQLPAYVAPRRFHRNPPTEQEPLRGAITRLGALGSVVPGTGEVVLEHADLLMPARGVATSVEPTYRSDNDYPGPMGYGWNPSWNAYIIRVDDDNLTLFRGDGRTVPFTRNASGTLESIPGIYAVLEEIPGAYRIREPGGILITFAALTGGVPGVYPLAAMEDQYRNRTNYRYGAHGRLTYILDALGRTCPVGFDPAIGRCVQLGDHAGNTSVYRYFDVDGPDGVRGNLRSAESPAAKPSRTDSAVRRITGYTYYDATKSHRLHTVQDPEGLADSLPALVTMTYHQNGHVEKQTYGDGDFEFTPSPGQLVWKDREGNERTLTFHPPPGNGFGSLVATSTITVDGDDLEHSYQYNTAGELTRHEFPLGNYERFVYHEAAADPRDRGNMTLSARGRGTSPNQHLVAQQGTYSPNTGSGSPPTYLPMNEIVVDYRYVPGYQYVATFSDPFNHVTTYEYATA